MSESAMARLTGLLSAHAAKKQKLAGDATERAAVHMAKERKAASDAAERARVEFERMREFLAVRDAVIAPIAAAFAKQLVASGYRARTEATDCTPKTLYAAAVPGRLTFAFGLDAAPETSALTFIGYPSAVQVEYDLSAHGSRTATFVSSREFRPSELTQKVVEDILLDFVAKVLSRSDA